MLKDNIGIVVIIVLFLISNIIFLSFYSDVWWDSSVYIGMGKYMYSLGKSGLWEESRPLIFPLILGIGYLLNFNLVYFGRTISIIFAVLVIFMTYRVGLKLFSKKIGLLAAFFVAFSYTFLFFSSNILTEIPSTLFVLLAFYFFIKGRFFLVGLFSGLAVMTRFFQVFILVGIGLVFILYFWNKPQFGKKLISIVAGASIFILPYVFLNYYLYNDILLPFKVQAHLTQTTGWALYRDYGFYFIGLLKENFFVVSLLLLPLFFKKNHKFLELFLIPLIYILIFSFVKHKEMRFMISIFPFLYLLTSYYSFQIYSRIKQKKIAFTFFSLLMIIWLSLTLISFKSITLYKQQRDDEGLLYFQNYLKNNRGNVWITNPLYTLYSEDKIEGLLYFYSSKNLIEFINKNKEDAEIILFNSCDIPCVPIEIDHFCKESKNVLEKTLSKFNKVYQKEINSCRYEIYRRAIS